MSQVPPRKKTTQQLNLTQRVHQQLLDLPDLPKPGGGRTLERWQALSLLGAEDLCLAKVLEAHYDALAIFSEAHLAPPPAGTIWGVWAAGGPQNTVRWDEDTGLLEGKKAWCSGGDGAVTHALLTVDHAARSPLVAAPISAQSANFDGSQWLGPGMGAVPTGTIDFRGVPAERIGDDDFYLGRPGFWHGGAGIAACWYGAATAIAERVRQSVQIARNPFSAAHLGAIDGLLTASAAMMSELARMIDERPQLAHQAHVVRARCFVDRACRDIMDRAAVALGPAPLCTEQDHATRCADLAVFIRQCHAERDEQWLGETLHQQEASPWQL